MTKADTKPAAKKRAARKAKAPDLATLARLAAELAEYTGGGDLTDLLRRLEIEEGAKIDDAPGGKRVRMAGIEASSTAGLHGALMNWVQAARRAVLRGGV